MATLTGPRCASVQGFSLHATTQVPAHRREQLERLMRYTARGAVSLERLTQNANGDLVSTCTHPWSDGTTGMRLSPLEVLTIHPYAAGIAIGSRFHVVAVPPELAPEPVRTYQSFTDDLHRMADWLVELGITTVAMESTGIDWIPACEILEARGLEVLLVNARHVKNVPGRKTDVHDALWLQQLHQHGLLRGSFRPANG